MQNMVRYSWLQCQMRLCISSFIFIVKNERLNYIIALWTLLHYARVTGFVLSLCFKFVKYTGFFFFFFFDPTSNNALKFLDHKHLNHASLFSLRRIVRSGLALFILSRWPFVLARRAGRPSDPVSPCMRTKTSHSLMFRAREKLLPFY